MKIDVIYEKGILCEFLYSPLNEMFCALHVLNRPHHHLHRVEWAEDILRSMNESFKSELFELSEITNEFLIVMDFCSEFSECNDLNIPSAIEFLKDAPFHKIKNIFKEYNKDIKKSEYDRLLDFIKRFYLDIFESELKYIEPFITRILKSKVRLGQDIGIINLIDTIHERIKIEEDEIVFLKYKEFRFKIKEIKQITLNLSTFISPHLLLGMEENKLILTFLVELKDYKKDSPKDLEKTLKALGDGTRLKILKEISKKGKSTQELSELLGISEAAVSKALKLLQEGNLVLKERRGNYILYSPNNIEIDYLPYKI